MDAPDIGKHLREMVGGLVIDLATAKAVIEQQAQALVAAKAGRETSDGAQGADEPTKG